MAINRLVVFVRALVRLVCFLVFPGENEMNLRKLVGRGLLGFGFLLMLIGTVSVPSTSWARAAGVVCNGTCNKCGSSQTQPDGSFKCFTTVGGVNNIEYCNSGTARCQGCTGGCDTDGTVGGVASCACLLN